MDGLTDLRVLHEFPDARVNRGDLLPLVDASDPATWACLLADLAEAVNARIDQKRHDRFWPQRGLMFTSRAGSGSMRASSGISTCAVDSRPAAH